MFGLEDLKIQLLVLNLVAAEILCGGWSREEAGEYERRQAVSNARIEEEGWAHHVGSPRLQSAHRELTEMSVKCRFL
jgi:hypothetical protein